ncbi:hypothetical protein F4780DRAFT_758492 [Xylariomycetidae sp. FL0641]|nr:hypothetical protein F4780DRAFT_758492 [Xylariomycetidae sp. FL0641]
MARNRNRNQRVAPLPPKFKCRVGKEWKMPAEFAPAMIAKWNREKENDPMGIINAENIGLVCNAHVAGDIPQLKCYGPCHFTKVKSQFSKNQRKLAEPVSSAPFIAFHGENLESPLTPYDSGASSALIGETLPRVVRLRPLPRMPRLTPTRSGTTMIPTTP